VIVVAIYVDPGLLPKLGNDQLQTLTTLISAGNRVRMVLELDQVDVLTRPVLRHFQQIYNAREAGTPRQSGCDLIERDPSYRGHLDKSGAQSVMSADLNVRTTPDPHAASDFAAHDWFAKSLGKNHYVSVAQLRLLRDALFAATRF
jgi:hypothetical protein